MNPAFAQPETDAGKRDYSAVAFSAQHQQLLQKFGLDSAQAAQVLSALGVKPADARAFLDDWLHQPGLLAQRMLAQGWSPQKTRQTLSSLQLDPVIIDGMLQDLATELKKLQLDYTSGWGDMSATLDMEIKDDKGNVTQRQIRFSSLEVTDGGDLSLSVFVAPKDLKDTALLTRAQFDGPDLQWLYMPRIKRIKKVSMLNMGSPFMGSEFSYEDMAPFEQEKYAIHYLDRCQLQQGECFLIELQPLSEHSGYARMVSYVSAQFFQALKIEYYDQDNQLLKTLFLEDYRQYQNKFWRPSALRMVNARTQRETVINWRDYKFDNGLTEKDFSKQVLRRIKS